MEIWAILLAVVLVAAYVGAIALILVSIVRSADLSVVERWAWSALVVFFPLVGSLAWGLFGTEITKFARSGSVGISGR
ncbi:MAG: PLDc N-terminal domain-containing protein [Cryobacterium sp.]|nr:PLDc N-terminal domain-containing protein [Cryobacterium sp.]